MIARRREALPLRRDRQEAWSLLETEYELGGTPLLDMTRLRQVSLIGAHRHRRGARGATHMGPRPCAWRAWLLHAAGAWRRVEDAATCMARQPLAAPTRLTTATCRGGGLERTGAHRRVRRAAAGAHAHPDGRRPCLQPSAPSAPWRGTAVSGARSCACCGSTPMPTSTPTPSRPAAMCMACRSPACAASGLGPHRDERPGAGDLAKWVRQIGIRSVDEGERRFVHEQDLDVFDAALHRRDRHARRHGAGWPPWTPTHLHQLRRGLSRPQHGSRRRHHRAQYYREAHLCMEMISDSGLMVLARCPQLNPALDSANKTALVAVDLIESALRQNTLMRKPCRPPHGRTFNTFSCTNCSQRCSRCSLHCCHRTSPRQSRRQHLDRRRLAFDAPGRQQQHGLLQLSVHRGRLPAPCGRRRARGARGRPERKHGPGTQGAAGALPDRRRTRAAARMVRLARPAIALPIARKRADGSALWSVVQLKSSGERGPTPMGGDFNREVLRWVQLGLLPSPKDAAAMTSSGPPGVALAAGRAQRDRRWQRCRPRCRSTSTPRMASRHDHGCRDRRRDRPAGAGGLAAPWRRPQLIGAPAGCPLPVALASPKVDVALSGVERLLAAGAKPDQQDQRARRLPTALTVAATRPSPCAGRPAGRRRAWTRASPHLRHRSCGHGRPVWWSTWPHVAPACCRALLWPQSAHLASTTQRAASVPPTSAPGPSRILLQTAAQSPRYAVEWHRAGRQGAQASAPVSGSWRLGPSSWWCASRAVASA